MSMHRRPVRGRRTGLAVAALAVAALTTLGASAPALAAKGTGGGKPAGGTTSSSSLKLVLLDSSDGVAHWGQRITFTVSTTATTRPYVSLDCYQGGAWVSTASVGYFPEYTWAQEFTLSSGWWTGGAADCTAQLYYVNNRGKSVALTSLDVPVAG